MRFIFACGALWLLVACSGVPVAMRLSPQPQKPDQVSFVAALEQFSSTNKLLLLDDFKQRYPDSPWSVHAETITLYARELDSRKTQLSSLQKEKQQLLTDLAALKQDNLLLNEKIEQLKMLLIELEQRPR